MTIVLAPTWVYRQRDKLVTLQWSGLWDVISLQTLCWEIEDKSRTWNNDLLDLTGLDSVWSCTAAGSVHNTHSRVSVVTIYRCEWLLCVVCLSEMKTSETRRTLPQVPQSTSDSEAGVIVPVGRTRLVPQTSGSGDDDGELIYCWCFKGNFSTHSSSCTNGQFLCPHTAAALCFQLVRPDVCPMPASAGPVAHRASQIDCQPCWP